MAVVAALCVLAAADDDVGVLADDVLDEAVPGAWLELEPPQPAVAATTAATIAGVTACVRTGVNAIASRMARRLGAADRVSNLIGGPRSMSTPHAAETARRPLQAIPLPREAAAAAAEPLPEHVEPRRLWRTLGALAALAVLVVLAIVLLPGVADLRHRFAQASPWWIVLAVGLETASALSYVVAFRYVFCTRMHWSASYKIAMSELGVNSLLPVGGAGGLALGAWALRRAGMPSEQIARKTVAFFLLTSAPNIALLILLGPALAVGLVPGHVSLALALVPAGAAVFAVLVTLGLGRLSARLGRLAEQEAPSLRRKVLLAARAGGDGVDDAVALLSTRNIPMVLGLLGYLVFDILVLWATFRSLGSAPPVAVLTVAYIIGQLGNLVPLPAGIGGVELGLVGALVLYGAHAVTATAAVLLYRAIQLWLPAALGITALIQLRALLHSETVNIAVCGEGDAVEILGRGPVVVRGAS